MVNRQALLIVGVVMLALIIDGLDVQLLALVAPVILQEWQIPRSAFGPAMSAALFGMALGASVGGWLGDHYGRKHVLVLAIIWFGLATIAAGTADSVSSMALWRLAGGLGFGAAGPNGVALASDWTVTRWRPRVISALSIGVPLGGLIGSATVAKLVPLLGWRGCFFLCGGISIALALLSGLLVRESPEFQPGLAKQAGGTLRAVLAPEYSRLNWGSAICFFCISVVAYAFAAWGSVFLTTAGFTLAEALRALLTFNLCAVTSAIVTGFLLTKMGSKLLMSLAGLLLFVALTMMIGSLSLGWWPKSLIFISVACGIAGATTGCLLASLATLLVMGYAAHCRTTGVGLGMMLGRSGGIAIAFAGGLLLSLRGDDPLALFATLVAATALAFVGLFIIDRHLQRAATK